MEPTLDENKLELQVIDSKIPTEVVYDFKKIGQVVRNILSNAIKFTPTGKKITISFESATLPTGRRGSDTSITPAINIIIKDEGVGIPDDELSLVFDKFVQSSTTKKGDIGTGLGLSICMEIVKAHGGKIWAENNPEGGTAFCFMLPYDQKKC